MNYGAQQVEGSGQIELGKTWIWGGGVGNVLWSIVSLGLQHLFSPPGALLLLLFAP